MPSPQKGEIAMMTRIETDASKTTTREGRLLAILMEHTCKNAVEVLADSDYWCEYEDDEHGCGEDAKVAFEDAIGRCMNGEGTDADWDWLVDMTQM